MNKEHVKSILLTGLVGMNIVLGSQILLDKKLWSSDYNFFNIENFSILKFFKGAQNNDESFKKVSHLTMPEKIIFNTGDQTTRFSLNSNNKEYTDIIEYCNEVLISALSSSSISEITQDEWFSSLMTESIYLSYYSEYDTELFSKFLGVPETLLSEHSGGFSNAVISLYDNVTVYIDDAKSDKYYRIKTGNRFSDFKKIAKEIIKNHNLSETGQDAINYSFDLNFDKTFGSQKTVISSMVPIYSNAQSVPVVTAESPWSDFSEPYVNSTKNAIVKAFSLNSNIANRYTEADGTTVYVENNATLKIHPDGLLEYKARDNGLPLSGSGGRYNIISAVNEFVTNINNISKANDSMYISSGVGEESDIITFDYICEGFPVKMSIGDLSNAVYCQISNGCIKEYRHILRNYNRTDSVISTPEYILAVDNIIQQYSSVTQEVTINKLYLAYTDSGSNQNLSADWTADVEAIVLNEEE